MSYQGKLGCFVILVLCVCGKPLQKKGKLELAKDDSKVVDAVDSDNIGPLQDESKLGQENQLKFDALKGVKRDPKISLDMLKPVDHMDAVKMEQDGHVNKEYHKELFLGNHEQMEEDPATAEKKLIDIFRRVDSDNDGKLSEAEMEAWIIEKIDEHFDEAAQENDEIFKHLDPDGNGLVPWKEYYLHFLLAKGYEEPKAQKHVVDYDEIELKPDEKEELVRYKFRWTDADLDPADNQLNKTEFLGFRHPEQSERTISSMVSSIMNSMDTDEDEVLSLTEFIALPPGEVEGEEYREMDRNWQEERKAEFREIIDKDKNGKVDTEELKAYLNPRNKVQALMEARNLITLMDEDRDKLISEKEMLKRKDIFLTSKVVDFAANVHDEF